MQPQATAPAPANPGTGSFRRSLGTSRIALLVIAAAAPLGVVVGNVPLGILLGNGAGLPVTFAVSGALIVCFAVGYVAVSRVAPVDSGFAGFVRAALGPGAGRGTAYATTLAYAAGAIAITVGAGYFTSLIADSYGIEVPWWALSLVVAALVAAVGRRAADVSAVVLFVLVAAEFAVLLVLAVAVVVGRGTAAFPLESFAPAQITSGSIGPALLFGLTSFIGVESAVLYAREARDPDRSIPRATYLAVGVVAIFYLAMTWIVIGAFGAADVVAAATELKGDLVFAAASQYGGPLLVVAMQVFFCTSLLACVVALHNAATRYLQMLGAQGDLPRPLAVVHARHHGPTRASDGLAALTVAVIVVAAVAGIDPYLGVNTALVGLFTIGIVAMQALVAVATLVLFRRRRDPRLVRTLVAPALAAIGLLAAVGAIVGNYSLLSGSDALAPNLLPVLVPLALLAGFVVPAVRRRSESTAQPVPE